MARPKKQTPFEAFQDNLDDAEALLDYARAFSNNRARRMRRELRERVGAAIAVPQRRWDELDCLESDDLFVVFKPDGALARPNFSDLRPLLRQAVVAGCAALETYLADKAMEYVGPALRSPDPPRRLLNVSMTIGRWREIEARYKRKSWGVRPVVEEAIREMSSTAPNQVGAVLSLIGISDWAKKVDDARQVAPGTTVTELEKLTERRNRIAHSADRRGQGRALIDIDEADSYLDLVHSVAEAIEAVLKRHRI